MQQTYDLVVVGAGIGGLITAHRYLELHPTATVAVLDRNRYVGGVYSRDRIYPGFHTQFVYGLAEFSDLKMREPSKEDCIGDCFKATWLGKYLEEFAETRLHDGKSLMERIRLGTEVVRVVDESRSGKTTNQARWSLMCREIPRHESAELSDLHGVNSQSSTEETCILRATKLVIAAGEYCLPNIPHFKNQTEFEAPIIHSTNFGLSNLLSSPNIKHLAILGAGKSSADILYMCLKSLPPSTSVHWIIRPDGTGPGFFAPVDLPSPYKNAVEAAQTRAMSLLQPCAFHEDGWWVWFLHRTWIGIWLITWIFGLVDKEAKKRAGYTTRPDATIRGFDKLEYSPGIFWQNNSGGALHHSDFWDMVASRVIVHRARIVSTSYHTLHLSDDTKTACDALLLGTGFESSLKFLPEAIKAELGVPHATEMDSTKTVEKWALLDAEQDKEVLQRFPILANPPDHYLKEAKTTPWRLYRGITPLYDSDRDVVFINHSVAGNMMMNAEAQAHWAVAYLSNKLTLPSVSRLEKEVALQVAYCRRRMLSAGQLGNYYAFDMIAYIDLLMEDLGVQKVWKRKGAWGVNRPADLGAAWAMWKDMLQ